MDKQIKVDPTQYYLPSKEELRAKLSDMQFRVTQNAATEPPFHNEFYDSKTVSVKLVVTSPPMF